MVTLTSSYIEVLSFFSLSFYYGLFFHIFWYKPLFIFGEKGVSKENFNLLKLNQAPLPPKGTAGADGGVFYFHFVLYVSVCHIIPLLSSCSSFFISTSFFLHLSYCLLWNSSIRSTLLEFWNNGTYFPYLWHIFGIYLAYLWHVFGI